MEEPTLTQLARPWQNQEPAEQSCFKTGYFKPVVLLLCIYPLKRGLELTVVYVRNLNIYNNKKH